MSVSARCLELCRELSVEIMEAQRPKPGAERRLDEAFAELRGVVDAPEGRVAEDEIVVGPDAAEGGPGYDLHVVMRLDAEARRLAGLWFEAFSGR